MIREFPKQLRFPCRTRAGFLRRVREKLTVRALVYAFFNPASTRSGVNGASRRRTPVASKIALAIAAAIGALDGSPPPRAGISGRLINTISISGTSGNLMIG